MLTGVESEHERECAQIIATCISCGRVSHVQRSIESTKTPLLTLEQIGWATSRAASVEDSVLDRLKIAIHVEHIGFGPLSSDPDRFTFVCRRKRRRPTAGLRAAPGR